MGEMGPQAIEVVDHVRPVLDGAVRAIRLSLTAGPCARHAVRFLSALGIWGTICSRSLGFLKDQRKFDDSLQRSWDFSTVTVFVRTLLGVGDYGPLL
jgi:hypothetical protein